MDGRENLPSCYITATDEGRENLQRMAEALRQDPKLTVGTPEALRGCVAAMIYRLFLNPDAAAHFGGVEGLKNLIRNKVLHVVRVSGENCVEKAFAKRDELGFRLKNWGRVHITTSKSDTSLVDRGRAEFAGKSDEFIEWIKRNAVVAGDIHEDGVLVSFPSI
jgi:hypothetical protein